MNDKFIKLALDAGLLNYVDHETPRHYFINGHAEQEDVEKFAKLIVLECVSICQDVDGEDNIDARSGRQDCAVEIKKHFGVE
jgi:hypothetical protein